MPVRPRILIAFFLALLVAFAPAAVRGEEANREDKAGEPAAGAGRDGPENALRKPAVTRHIYRGPGAEFEYTATAGYLRIGNGSEKSPRADIFFTAYTTEGRQRESRPVTFLFNGGPGASSVWLHLGVAGPVRVITEGDGNRGGAPRVPVENPHSWLPWTDLVFIDPVGTGFSRTVQAGEARQFYGTREDVRSVGDFIRLYLSTFDRWPSPKCLAGESYGAMRAAGLLRYLYETYGIEFDGLIMISPALDLDAIQSGPANDLPHVLFLPSYTAAAWYHDKIAPELRQGSLTETLAEAERWAIEEYLPALAWGDLLPGGERAGIIRRFAMLTGLPETLIRNRNLRVTRPEFTSELLREEGLTLGFMDGRTVSRDERGSFLNEPSMARTVASYTAAMNEYSQNVLKFSPERAYTTFSEEANSQWSWGPAVSPPIDAVNAVRKALHRNRRLKILAAAGYFDLATPYFSTVYMMNRLGIAPALRENIKIRFFPGGHMFYLSGDTLEEFAEDVSRFFEELTAGRVETASLEAKAE